MDGATDPSLTTTKLGTARVVDRVTGVWRKPSVRSRATVIHYVSLGGALLFLLWTARHQWFSGDEWDFLVNRHVLGHHGLDLWEPHNEHWSTIPILMYRALFSVFGVRTYLPYLLVLFGFHLMVAHLLWRLMLRVGVEPMLATAASAVFAVLGAGWEALVFAFNFTFMMPIAFGLLALLLMPDRGPFQRRDVYGWVCNVVGLLCSGVAITMVVVVGFTALLRRGWRVALLTVSVPALVYFVWFVLRGRHAESVGQQPFTTAVQQAPAFVWQGLVGAVEGVTGLSGSGPVILVLLAIWVVRSARPFTPSWSVVLAAALGAPLFLFLVDIRRSGLGVEQAAETRYTYVVVALLVPVAALGSTALIAGRPFRPYLLLGVTAALLLVGGSSLAKNANDPRARQARKQNRIIAAADFLRSGAPTVSDTPAPEFAAYLKSADLVALARQGKLPGNVHVTESDRLTAAEFLQLRLGPHPAAGANSHAEVVGAEGADIAPAPDPGCVAVLGTSDHPTVFIAFSVPGSVRVTTARSGALTAQLQDPDGEVADRGRTWPATGGSTQVLSVVTTQAEVRLGVPPDGTTDVCGISGSP